MTYLSTSSIIGPFHFQARGRRRRPNLALVFLGSDGHTHNDSIYCASIASHGKNHTSIFHQIFCTLPAGLTWSCSNGSAICYVLAVLWMTCFRIMDRIGQNQRRCICLVQFAVWRHRGRSLLSPTASCCWFLLLTVEWS